jgi:zinc/manganese transport system permease protein
VLTALAAAPGAQHVTALIGILDQAFMRRAFLAGLAVAILAGVVGYLMVLRAQVFAGDALSHVAFTGALGALAAGVDPRLGLFVATIGVGVVLGLLGPRGRPDDVLIGIVFAWILGLGVLALSVYTASTAGATNGTAGVRVLFGSIFGLSSSAARFAAVVAAVLLLAALVITRPLVFASLDPAVAGARGVPVTALGVGFLALVGATAAEATQAVGALLLLGLLAAPAGAAQRLTAGPFAGLALSAGLSAAAMAIGLTVSYLVPSLSPSFAIIATAALIYALALAFSRRRPAPGPRPPDDHVGHEDQSLASSASWSSVAAAMTSPPAPGRGDAGTPSFFGRLVTDLTNVRNVRYSTGRGRDQRGGDRGQRDRHSQADAADEDADDVLGNRRGRQHLRKGPVVDVDQQQDRQRQPRVRERDGVNGRR